MFLALGLTGFVSAHPSGHGPSGAIRGPSILGQRIELGVGNGVVVVAYVAEVPFARLVQEGDPGEVAGRIARAVPDALRLTWEGEPVVPAWEPPVVAPGTTGFYDLSVRGRAVLPATEGTLHLRNGNFPDEPSFFATGVTLSGDLVVTGTSLARVKDGHVRDNQHGAWVKDEAAREPWLTIRPARPWERADEPRPLPERLAGLAILGPPRGWLVAAGVVVLVAVAGLSRAWRRRRTHLVASGHG